MAIQIIKRVLSDLSGEEATVTQTFMFDNKEYLIDLTEAEAIEFRKVMGPYLEAGTRAKRARTVADRYGDDKIPTTGAPNGNRSMVERRMELAPIRDWAAKQGIEVSNRGRIPQHVIDLYENRHTLRASEIKNLAEQAAKKLHTSQVRAAINGKLHGEPVDLESLGKTTPANGKAANGAAMVPLDFSDVEKPTPAKKAPAKKAAPAGRKPPAKLSRTMR